jgi:hypothetical protein
VAAIAITNGKSSRAVDQVRRGRVGRAFKDVEIMKQTDYLYGFSLVLAALKFEFVDRVIFSLKRQYQIKKIQNIVS